MMQLDKREIEFMRLAIHKAIMTKADNTYTWLEKLRDKFNREYPDGGVDE